MALFGYQKNFDFIFIVKNWYVVTALVFIFVFRVTFLASDYLKAEKAMILSGFRAAGISEGIENAKSIIEKVENPFKEL